MDELERELRSGLQRRPAPPSLKRKILERRRQQRARQHRRMVWFERLAASVVLAGVAGGAAFWRHEVDERKGEEAKQQVFTALRVTNHALQVMNEQLEKRTRIRGKRDSR